MSRFGRASVVVAAMLTIALAACGGNAATTEATTTEAEATADDDGQAAAQAAYEQDLAERKATFEGRSISEFALTIETADGQATDLATIAAGKPLLVNMWATWCVFCDDEMPDLQGFYHEYGDRVNFAFVDMCDGNRETQESVAAYIAEKGLEDLPVYFDTTQALPKAYSVKGYPCTLIINADGTINSYLEGRIDTEEVRGILAGLAS